MSNMLRATRSKQHVCAKPHIQLQPNSLSVVQRYRMTTITHSGSCLQNYNTMHAYIIKRIICVYKISLIMVLDHILHCLSVPIPVVAPHLIVRDLCLSTVVYAGILKTWEWAYWKRLYE